MRNYFNPHNIEPFIPTKNAGDNTENGTNAGDINVRSKMSYAEAIRILENIETDIYGRIAIAKAIDALKGPWVKTEDRLPTEADADNTMCWVLATTKSSNLPMPEAIAYIRANPDNYPYWMPIPPLPETFARGHENGGNHADK